MHFFKYCLVFTSFLLLSANAFCGPNDLKEELRNKKHFETLIKNRTKKINNKVIEEVGLDEVKTDEVKDEKELLNIKLQKRSALEDAYEKILKSDALEHIEMQDEKIEQKGYEIFRAKNDKVLKKNVLNRDFNSNFQLVLGDELYIATYGSSELEFNVTVDRNNNIFIPKVGVINIGGINFPEAQKTITKKIKEYYIGSKVYIKLLSRMDRSVFVTGRVSSPGIISIGSGTSLIKVLIKAGGISKKGSLRNIKIQKGKKTTKVDLYGMLISGKSSAVVLSGGEKIFVPPLKTSVAVIGEVLDPGVYELTEKSNLKEMVEKAQGISPLGYGETINIYRPTNVKNTVNAFSIKKEDFSKFKLLPYDVVQIMTRKHILGNGVTVIGAVEYPGRYQLSSKKNTLMSVLKQVGGLTKFHSDKIFIKRELDASTYLSNNGLEKSIVENEVFELILSDQKLSKFIVKAGDTIEVSRKDPIVIEAGVKILGEINYPGDKLFQKNMNLLQLIKSGNGITPLANIEAVTVARTLEENQVWHISLPEKGSIQEKLISIKLEPGDVITIPKKMTHNILVKASGEFNKPGTYLLTKGARLSDLITAAGGLTKNSYFQGSAFYRASVAKKYDERLKLLADKLEQDLLRTQNKEAQSSFDSQVQKNELIFAKQERLIEKMKSTKSLGRVAMNLPSDTEYFENNPQNIVLEKDDSLVVPSQPSTVSIIGQINNQNTVVYVEKYSIQDYLDQAGGLTRFADTKNIFIIKANGSIIPANKLVVKRGGWISGRSVKTFKGNIEPGDTVYVPEDYAIKTNSLQRTKDITQIIFQILTSVGVAVAAF